MRRIWAETMYENVYKKAPVSSAIRGDVNDDGKFDLTDLVAMQKYLLKKGSISNLDNADLTGDGSADVFDLAMMKRELLEEK